MSLATLQAAGLTALVADASCHDACRTLILEADDIGFLADALSDASAAHDREFLEYRDGDTLYQTRLAYECRDAAEALNNLAEKAAVLHRAEQAAEKRARIAADLAACRWETIVGQFLAAQIRQEAA